VEIIEDDGDETGWRYHSNRDNDRLRQRHPTTVTSGAMVGGFMLGGQEIGHGANAANSAETVLRNRIN
jgi:hypothetical protein